MITAEGVTYGTWCERSPRRGISYIGVLLTRLVGAYE